MGTVFLKNNPEKLVFFALRYLSNWLWMLLYLHPTHMMEIPHNN